MTMGPRIVGACLRRSQNYTCSTARDRVVRTLARKEEKILVGTTEPDLLPGEVISRGTMGGHYLTSHHAPQALLPHYQPVNLDVYLATTTCQVNLIP